MRIALASDHAGRQLRLAVVEHLREGGHEISDLGTHTADSVDYPHYAKRIATTVAQADADLGILVCGTGVGMSIAANHVRGARAALCVNEYMARLARAHNNANVLCLGERVLGVGAALSIVDAFLSTSFEGGRHARRVEQIEDWEK
ncbi:MAG: ribose 5-phosphate isomerase B [Myxococcota bacterium]